MVSRSPVCSAPPATPPPAASRRSPACATIRLTCRSRPQSSPATAADRPTPSPAMTSAHLDIYEKYGLAPQSRHLGAPVAYMYAESGEVNTIVHQWAYADAADRTARRAAMWKDPEWLVYIGKLNESGYLVEQKNSL